MVLYAGLDVTSACTPEMAFHDAFFLDCGATLANPGPHTLLVVVTEATTEGGVGEIHAYTLPPGGPSVQVTMPAADHFWVVVAQTAEAAAARGTWRLLGSFALWGLAGWGASTIIGEIIERVRHRR